ncbi:MAG: WecB/TagA/CpsF family glycosyltransferase [Ignavibacteriales bacterium]|nr:WecB/TagA/CpsF family glycosyltransferase [Ignavibacteriales bacterium]
MTGAIFDKLIVTEKEILSQIDSHLKNRQKLLITYLNQHCFNIYSSNKNYKNLIDNKFLVYADGAGIKFALRFIMGKKYIRFNATDLNEKIMEILLKRKINFFILGGNFNQKELITKFNRSESFVGYNNGFFLDNEFENVIEKIRTAKPDVIIIGMGVPKQEIVAEKLSISINASLFICVGNFFEFYFGTTKRIPVHFRNKGIEWIYRLFHEPKRLWKRYLIGIPLFILRVIRFKLTLNKFG